MKVLQNWGFGTNKKGQSSRGFDSYLCRCLFEKIATSILKFSDTCMFVKLQSFWGYWPKVFFIIGAKYSSTLEQSIHQHWTQSIHQHWHKVFFNTERKVFFNTGAQYSSVLAESILHHRRKLFINTGAKYSSTLNAKYSLILAQNIGGKYSSTLSQSIIQLKVFSSTGARYS